MKGIRCIRVYADMARRYLRMAAGTSYWHLPLGPGTQFVPGKLVGYFIDLRDKTRWTGLRDTRGLPLSAADQGKPFLFPTTVLQKGLGHWDCWLEAGRLSDEHESGFRSVADWTVETQDAQGGWPIWPLLEIGDQCETPYSAMTQGQAVSVLVRAFSESGQQAYLRAAERATALMLKPLEQGGTSREAAGGLVLEEGPYPSCRAILNGWIFALFGLYDLELAAGSGLVSKELESTVNTLTQWLPQYDAGFWSRYDLSGHLASPFYHRLHQAQLMMCRVAFPCYASAIHTICQRFEAQSASRLNTARALLTKSWQKLWSPPHVLVQEARPTAARSA